jgi:IclR family pca regulon transcriptional regulator
VIGGARCSPGVRLGARLPAYASATGRVLLAGLPPQQRDAYLRTITPQATTPNTLTDVAAIRDSITQAAIDGYSLTDEELELGMRTLALPVCETEGTVRAAMSTSTFTVRVSVDELLTRHLAVLQTQAAEWHAPLFRRVPSGSRDVRL